LSKTRDQQHKIKEITVSLTNIKETRNRNRAKTAR